MFRLITEASYPPLYGGVKEARSRIGRRGALTPTVSFRRRPFSGHRLASSAGSSLCYDSMERMLTPR
jgi:hypothetical protein